MRIPLNGYTFAPALVSGNLVGFLGWKGDFSGVMEPNAVMPIVWMEKVVDTQGNAGWNTVAWDGAQGGGPGGINITDLTAASRWVQLRTGVARPFGRDGLLYAEPVAQIGVATSIGDGEEEQITTPVGVTRGLYNGDPLQYLMRTLPTVQQTELAQTLESVGYAIVPGFVPECPANPTPTDPNTPIDQTNANGRLPTTTQPAVQLVAGSLLETSYWEALGMTREAAAMRAGKKCTVEIILTCTGCVGTASNFIATTPWKLDSQPFTPGGRTCNYSREGTADFKWSGDAKFGGGIDAACILCANRCPTTTVPTTQKQSESKEGTGPCGPAPTSIKDDTFSPHTNLLDCGR